MTFASYSTCSRQRRVRFLSYGNSVNSEKSIKLQSTLKKFDFLLSHTVTQLQKKCFESGVLTVWTESGPVETISSLYLTYFFLQRVHYITASHAGRVNFHKIPCRRTNDLTKNMSVTVFWYCTRAAAAVRCSSSAHRAQYGPPPHVGVRGEPLTSTKSLLCLPITENSVGRTATQRCPCPFLHHTRTLNVIVAFHCLCKYNIVVLIIILHDDRTTLPKPTGRSRGCWYNVFRCARFKKIIIIKYYIIMLCNILFYVMEWFFFFLSVILLTANVVYVKCQFSWGKK